MDDDGDDDSGDGRPVRRENGLMGRMGGWTGVYFFFRP